MLGRRSTHAAMLVLLALVCTGKVRAGLEKDLRAQWRGAWVVIMTESYSRCDSRYTENNVNGTRVSANGHRFPENELGKIDQVQVRRERVELHIDLDVPRLLPYQEGPFTLYREHACRLSLDVRLPRKTIKQGDFGTVQAAITQVVEKYPSRRAAYDSGSWNGREMEPYPEDYERTLALHAAWVAEQLNLAIDDKREQALDDATDLARGIETDRDYLRGLAAGVRAVKDWYPRDCERLVKLGFARVRKPVPEEDEDNVENWHRGYEDGQRLVYDLEILKRIERCYVPIPAVPGYGAE